MLISKKKLLFVLIFGIILGNIPCAYSNILDLYDGRVKYGTYKCLKDGETCNFEIYENHSSYGGGACPKNIPGEDSKSQGARIADFLNSEYCSYTSTQIKKYVCSYDVGSATIYVEDGKVKSANYGFTPTPERSGQLLYEPDKCVEKPMEGDNGEPPLERNSRQNNPSPSYDSSNDDSSNISPNNYYQLNFIKNTVEQSVRQEMKPATAKMAYLQDETEILKKTINSLEKKFQYLVIFLVVIFIISLAALIKSNNNDPNKRL